ncbi:MAG: HAD family hydrolase [Deferribacteraceae bacterium]|jgi:D-glycero-D-manno-heptose 1,7-bisphosphate phosphatase|nr:HAD family hydrolase [Deferribacteraceae bacterium]
MALLRPTAFIDRDGTINIDGGYINHPDNFEVYPYAAQAIRMLNVAGWLVVVVTNQSGIGRGFYTEGVMADIHAKMNAKLNAQGATIDGLYACPHDPNSKIEQYRIECECRKPKTGMFDQAIRELPVDTARMAIIGDKYSDMEPGFKLGMTTIMVATGYGQGDFILKSAKWARQPDYKAANLLEAVRILLKK